MSITNTLNSMYSELLKSDFREFTRYYDLTGSVTRLPKEAVAFVLQDPACGRISSPITIEPDKINYTGVVVRSVVPYRALVQMQSNYALGCFVLSNYMNAMLLAASKVGPIDRSAEIVSFCRPGAETEFLCDMENNAGCELRLLVKW